MDLECMGSVDRQDKPSPDSPDPLLGFLATESSSDPVAALVPGLPQVAWWGERALTGLGDWHQAGYCLLCECMRYSPACEKPGNKLCGRQRERGREARITAWVGMKVKKMEKRKDRKWFGLYVGM